MKLVSKALTIIGAVAALSACSADRQQSVTKSQEAADLFQRSSISRVGLSKKLALTFDDGPTKGTTEALLKYLREEGIKATFFVNGVHVPGQEATMKKMMDHGHVVANHTQHHTHLPRAVSNQGWSVLRKEIAATNDAIAPYTQPGGRLYFRAPHGAWKADFADYLNRDADLREYVGPMFWDIGGEISRSADGSLATAADWDCWGKRLSVAQCAQGYSRETDRRDGGIVLMHDVSINTVEMVKKLIPEWRRKGYTFVTLDEVQSLDRYTE
ncbi:MAG TPA: polysaccharide deacetylase family protein [Bdellovibrionales bacterium]|nr:polysaccharide deacetylase family protein [Bdellovibrionales bacterium]